MGFQYTERTYIEGQELLMVKHYPHILSWTGEGTSPSVDPATGFPIPGVPGLPQEAKARYENFKTGAVKEWRNKKNETVLQRGTIYVKKGEPTPKKFETVTVTSGEYGLMFEGEILNVYHGQLNTTIAV